MTQDMQQAEAATKDALAAVIGDSPQDARMLITALSFRERALLAAWAEEFDRLAREVQRQYESREREAWREREDSPAPGTGGPDGFRALVLDYLRERVATGDAWTCRRDVVFQGAARTGVPIATLNVWADAILRDLSRDGILSPVENRPDEYRVFRAPERDTAG